MYKSVVVLVFIVLHFVHLYLSVLSSCIINEWNSQSNELKESASI